MTELDVRGLPPPEPFLNITQALQTLAADSALRVLIHREPYPLYQLLADTGHVWQTTPQPDGNFEIVIRRAQ